MILYERTLPDGREISVMLMVFNFRVCIGDGLCYDDGWCYPHSLGRDFVLEAADSWNGIGDPPDGWIKQLSTGRRRENGDPMREYVER